MDNVTRLVLMDALKQGTTFAIYADSRDARTQHSLMCSHVWWNLKWNNLVPNTPEDRWDFMRGCGVLKDDIEALQCPKVL